LGALEKLRRRYDFISPIYESVALEWPIYRTGRVLGIELLALAPGHTVLDVGCGTGLNFPFLAQAIGPTGAITGIDISSGMLARASARGLHNVSLIQADAAHLPLDTTATAGSGGFDAALFTYSLSVIPDWEAAWNSACSVVKDGGRVAVVDMALPVRAAAILSPLARLACALGGADVHRHPWRKVESHTHGVRRAAARGGHIQIAVGMVRHDARA
jgi:S-adenosylmethionine-diacylgycerolhomoserine-N-methlytransferase